MTVLGASLLEDRVAFTVWAPRCRSVDVVVEGRRPEPLTPGAGGLYQATLARVAPGARYHYRLDNARFRPDPASRWQPEGVHGASVVVDPARFMWTDQDFRGTAPADLVFYELHVGTFTATGTFEAIIPYLVAIADLGVTALQLMPIAEFPGSRNWGYDGVHLFAPQSTYGGPRGLRRLVDAFHARGLSVLLDVVYNHLGPEGNVLAEYGPYLTDRHRTAWGPGVNFDGEGSAGVRRHVVENVRYWVREFHVDGVRLDAVHAIADGSAVHILAELAAAARAEGARAGRPVHVIAESHDNDRRLVLPPAEGGLGLDAVWSDDFHHALHRRLTGEAVGYYADFGGASALARALAEGFAFPGEPPAYWRGARGAPGAGLAAQTHDQVGNRPRGERLGTLVPPAAVRLAAALCLAAPAVPLLFMGEEYGETAPFQFFTSFLDPALAAAVRRWLALRREHPALGARGKALARADLDPAGAVLTLARRAPSGEAVRLVANLTAPPRPWAPPPAGWRLLLDSEDPRWGGAGGAAPLAPWQALLWERAR